MEPSSRTAALRIGAMVFDTGRPCKRGHRGPRYASSGGCIQCGRDAAAEQSARSRKARRKPTSKPRHQPVNQPQDQPVRWWREGFIALDELPIVNARTAAK